jgi:hypothetical protein
VTILGGLLCRRQGRMRADIGYDIFSRMAVLVGNVRLRFGLGLLFEAVWAGGRCALLA